MKTVEQIIAFLKSAESVMRCEKDRGTVGHCSCLSWAVNEIACEHKDKLYDFCKQCNEELKDFERPAINDKKFK